MVVLNLVVSGILVGCIYALFAVGLTLSLGVMRVLNVAHGAVLSLAGILAVQAAGNVPGVNSLPTVIIAAMVVGAVAGLLIDLFAIQPTKRADKLTPSQIERGTLIGTLAFLYAFDSVSTTRTSAQAVSLPLSVFRLRPVKIGSINTSNAEILAFFVALVVFALMVLIVRRTQVGRALRATALDTEAAQYLGVNVRLYSGVSSAVAGALAGLAGVLIVASLGTIDYTTGDNLINLGFCAVILGGIGSIEGSLLGGLLLGVGGTVVAYYVGSQWQDMVPILLFAVLAVVRPRGLFGSRNVRTV